MRSTHPLLALAGGLVVLASAGCHSSPKATPHASDNTVRIAITENGFEPDHATVKSGKPVTLVVTRKTDDTCARSIVVPDAKVNAKLPLNQPVTVSFTPSKAGNVGFQCGMGMLKGNIVVAAP